MSSMQQRFAAALMAPDSPLPDGLSSWNSRQPKARYDVYRNNVMMGLRRALASRFPAAERIVGEDFFAAMADAFIRAHPPRSPLLFLYGDALPDFVAGFPPAQSVPYLADVMRLEIARGHAYHAADAAPLDPVRLASITPERLGDLRFTLHPAAAILRSAFPVVTIWAMNAGELPAAAIADWTPQDALVVRPHLVVEVLRLPPGGAVFLEALTDGMTLTTAAEAAMAADAAFDLAANLAGALGAGAFSAIHTDQGDQP
ncbi:MAG: DNA-binding domain-containing protein [Alphaproteobacteria bacterium]|nr:DNA-binding domain-containing protein [Alphaproteobacteria bacterium]MBU1549855.1 DNA-binding domain-containing protein [Alphaproteobacteria bacterium]MBU2336689.1 DNA-binding domain-containing protein [Alphaproteobacteria bacterium]MBU2387422.1 DNA-binding domain-containing protein [Alphaproteobacteria bacterium]